MTFARHHRLGGLRILLHIQPQVAFALVRVLTVAMIAVFRKDRLDVAREINRCRAKRGTEAEDDKNGADHGVCFIR